MSSALPSGYPPGEFTERSHDLTRLLCEFLGSFKADHGERSARISQDTVLDVTQVVLYGVFALIHAHTFIQGGFSGQDEGDRGFASRRLAGLSMGGLGSELSGVVRGASLPQADDERGRYTEDCRARGREGCNGFCLHVRHRPGRTIRADG
ncbi:hypothetical protein ACFY8N_39265 [Streptomyces collinus]|uniref:hypothetical protein n=1 Tax=Streptomyces collinus TaxID=42684 RepID=UPI003688AD8E